MRLIEMTRMRATNFGEIPEKSVKPAHLEELCKLSKKKPNVPRPTQSGWRIGAISVVW
jgi:hypothetical protein